MRQSNGKQGLSLAENMTWNSIGCLIYVFANWVITVLVVLLASDYTASGSLAVAMSVGNLFATIVQFKVRPVQVSDINDEHSSGDYIGMRVISIAFAIVFSFIYCGFSVAPDDYIVVAAYLLFKTGDAGVDVFHGMDQKAGRMDYVGKSHIIRAILIVILFTLGLVLFQSLIVAILLMAIATIAVIGMYDMPKANQFGSLKPLFNISSIAHVIQICLPGFAAALLCTFTISISRQVYGLERGNDLLGIYAAVATPAVIIQALAGYIYAPLLGPIAQAWKQGEILMILKLMFRFFALLSILIIASLVGFSLLGESLLDIVYGETIASYAYIMGPVVICIGATAALLFLLDLLIALRCFSGAITSTAVSLICCLASIYPFIHFADMNGISFCISLSYAVGIVISFIFVFVKLRRKTNLNLQK